MEKMRVYPVFYSYRFYADDEWHEGQNPAKIFADRNDAIAWIKKQASTTAWECEVTQEEHAGDGWYHLEFVTTDWEGDYDTVYSYQISGYPYYVE